MALHPTGDAAFCLLSGLLQETRAQKPAKQENEEGDHDRRADELGQC
jgi:hypothetical protein